MSQAEHVHRLQNSLATTASAATSLVTMWERMTDGQRYELAEMVARRASELQDVLSPVLQRMAVHADG